MDDSSAFNRRKTSFTLNTSVPLFSQWLVKTTSDLYKRRFKVTATSYIKLFAAQQRVNKHPSSVLMVLPTEAGFIKPKEDIVQEIPPAIEFEITEIQPNQRIEVDARCLGGIDGVVGYYFSLLFSISKSWPESAPVLRPVYARHLSDVLDDLDPLSDAIGAPENAQSVPDSAPPWELIPDHAWDRTAVKEWCKGKTHKEIGKMVSMEERTVINKIAQLRKAYPDAKIPTNDERKRGPTTWKNPH